jgi:hypothetical protein
VKVKIGQKDIIGYLFFISLAAACITIGIKVISNHHVVSGTFGVVMGTLLIAASVIMVLRKE